MSEIFNEQFSPVFTAENVANIPSPKNIFRGRETDWPVDIKIIVDAVKLRLEKLREEKSITRSC